LLDGVEAELELAERVRARDGGVLVEDATRCLEVKDGIDLEEAFLGTIAVARVLVVVFEVEAVVDDAIDCDRKPRIEPRICAFEFANKAIEGVFSTCTSLQRGTIVNILHGHFVGFAHPSSSS